MTEIDTAADLAETAKQRRRWRKTVTLGVALLVMISSAIVVDRVVRHHAASLPALQCGCGGGWLPPDKAAERGGALIVAARTPAKQSFVFSVYNPAAVAQTVVGLGATMRVLAYRPRITMSRTQPDDVNVVTNAAKFEALPVTVAPHETTTVRITLSMRCQGVGTAVYFGTVPLDVRNGDTTRTETVSLTTQFAVSGTAASTPCK